MAPNLVELRRAARKAAKPPEHLENPEAELWIEIVADYSFNDSASLSLLAAALEAKQRARRCREQIDRDGEVVLDRFGQHKPHPLLAAESTARAAFLAGMKLLKLDIGDAK